MIFYLLNTHLQFTSTIRLENGTVIGLIGEIHRGEFDTSITGFYPTSERSEEVDFTQGLFATKMGLVIRRPSSKDVSIRYFYLGKSLYTDTCILPYKATHLVNFCRVYFRNMEGNFGSRIGCFCHNFNNASFTCSI